MSSKRIFGIDVLKILAAFMVIVLHITGIGGVHNTSHNVNSSVAEFILVLSYPCVDIFGIISGYVGCTRKYSFTAMVRMWFQVLFYGCVCTTIVFFLNSDLVTGSRILSCFFPVVSNSYWYFTSYFLMFILIPIINVGISHVSDNSLTIIIIILCTVVIAVPCFSGIIWGSDPFVLQWGTSPIWLIILYILGSYIKRIEESIRVSNIVLVAIMLLSCSVVWIGTVFNVTALSQTLTNSSPFILSQAICWLLIFKKIKNENHTVRRIFESLTKLSFGVYLFASHKLILEYFNNFFAFIGDMNLPLMILSLFGISSCVLIVALFMEFIRQKLFLLLRIDILIIYLGGLIDSVCVRKGENNDT